MASAGYGERLGVKLLRMREDPEWITRVVDAQPEKLIRLPFCRQSTNYTCGIFIIIFVVVRMTLFCFAHE